MGPWSNELFQRKIGADINENSNKGCLQFLSGKPQWGAQNLRKKKVGKSPTR